MKTTVLKDKIDALFPCTWNTDFKADVNQLLDKYVEIVKTSDEANHELLPFIKGLCNTISETIECYYEGRRWLAFEKIYDSMNGTESSSGLIENLGRVTIMKEDFLYRGRVKENDKVFGIQDLFHIPLDKRGLVKTQRFSSPGFPCLYLGNSIFCCWEELRRPSLENLYFSAFRSRRQFSLFDLRIPDIGDYQIDKIDQTLKRLPLILACNIVVRNSNDTFKPEYIIPQFITDTIIMKNRALLEDKSIMENDMNIWGVIYSSTQIHSDFTHGRKYLENIVLPIVEVNSKKKYCQYLASLFDISIPSSYEYNITNEQYEHSTFALIEKELHNAEFEELEHMYIPDGVIYLDYLGNPVGVPTYANTNWVVE